jgi:hypothetical protein
MLSSALLRRKTTHPCQVSLLQLVEGPKNAVLFHHVRILRGA